MNVSINNDHRKMKFKWRLIDVENLEKDEESEYLNEV